MCEVVCRQFEASFLSHIETFYSSGVIFTIHWHRLVVIRVLLRCCDSDFAAADLPDACSCSRWINHSLSLSLSLCSRREMGSIKRCHGDGADFTSTVCTSAPLSWFWEEPSVPTGGRQINTNPSQGPPPITPTLKWCKTVGIGDPPPSSRRVQPVSAQCVGQSEQMKPWNCCRYRHFFFLRRGQQNEKSADGADKGRCWCSRWSSAGITPFDGTFLTQSDITWVLFLFFFSKTHWVKCGWDSAFGAKFMYICCSCVHRCMRALFENVYLMLFSSHVLYYEWTHLISCQSNVY